MIGKLGNITVVLHVPQWSGLIARSVHWPKQQPGRSPTHGKAKQEPQWFGSKARSAQDPLQHAGLAPLHYFMVSYKQGSHYGGWYYSKVGLSLTHSTIASSTSIDIWGDISACPRTTGEVETRTREGCARATVEGVATQVTASPRATSWCSSVTLRCIFAKWVIPCSNGINRHSAYRITTKTAISSWGRKISTCARTAASLLSKTGWCIARTTVLGIIGEIKAGARAARWYLSGALLSKISLSR